jgi:hypothetical protein
MVGLWIIKREYCIKKKWEILTCAFKIFVID